MADYRCKNRSNYFRVLDEEKYQKIVSRMSSSDGYFETGKKERDGQLHHNFVCEGQIMYVPEGWEEDCEVTRSLIARRPGASMKKRDVTLWRLYVFDNIML